MNKKTFYMTTPIYYPSASLHIGHALTTVMTDAMCRYKKLRGYDTYFLTGSDEHGQKIEKTAAENGCEPKEYVDGIVSGFKKLWKRLDIDYDDFIRTTDERHQKAVSEIFRRVYANGDIYKSEYEGWYCTPCETFFTERQLVDGKCPDCGREVEKVKEESYFFRMSRYQDDLLKHIEENPDFIQPESRKNEMVNFIKQGLEDLCVSRTTFNWGIPVPIDEGHVIYVWFDALSNYITALGYASEDDSLYRKYWPADIHLVGKDIVRFHTIIWPAILMSLGESLPQKVFGHGWLLLDSGKMSKSKGNVVDPNELIDLYGPDPIRYFLLREIPLGSDGYYSQDALIHRYNVDLANDYGNLLSRTVAMTEKYFGGVVPEPCCQEDPDSEYLALAAAAADKAAAYMDKLDFANALAEIWKLVGRSNKYIDETMPWMLAKDESRKDRLGTVLYNLLEALRLASYMLNPVMPSIPVKAGEQLGTDCTGGLWEEKTVWGMTVPGTKVSRKAAVFPRIEAEKKNEIPAPKQKEKNKKEDQKPAAKGDVQAGIITIDDFGKVDLRVGEVVACEKVEKADKLLKLTVNDGEGERTVVSGIAQYYTPEEMTGKRIIIVANLKPVKLRGILSQGMILAAGDEKGLKVIEAAGAMPGSRVK